MPLTKSIFFVYQALFVKDAFSKIKVFPNLYFRLLRVLSRLFQGAGEQPIAVDYQSM
jgi:hypothetical protein